MKFEVGKITFADQYMTLFPLLTLKEMTIDAIKKGRKGMMELYWYGWHFGFTFVHFYMKTFKLRKFEETYKLIMDVSELIGFGNYQTTDFRHKEFSRFKNLENPFGLLFHPSKEKVCHFVRGMNGGGGTGLHGVIMNGIELECAANNGKYCLFMNVINPILESKYKNIVKEQLDLKWLLKKQMKLIGEYEKDPNSFLDYKKEKVNNKKKEK